MNGAECGWCGNCNHDSCDCPEHKRRELGKAGVMAQIFHEAYERLAPNFSYETRKASRVIWEDVPENNRNLMIAVCEELLRQYQPI